MIVVGADEDPEGPSTNAGKLDGTNGAEDIGGSTSVDGPGAGRAKGVSGWEGGGELSVQLVSKL